MLDVNGEEITNEQEIRLLELVERLSALSEKEQEKIYYLVKCAELFAVSSESSDSSDFAETQKGDDILSFKKCFINTDFNTLSFTDDAGNPMPVDSFKRFIVENPNVLPQLEVYCMINGHPERIENKDIEVTEKIMRNKILVGYAFKVDSGKYVIHKAAESIVDIIFVLQPTNFTVRYRGGKPHMVGINGTRLDKLPKKDISSNPQILTEAEILAGSAKVTPKTVALSYDNRAVSIADMSCDILCQAISLLASKAVSPKRSIELDFSNTVFDDVSVTDVAQCISRLEKSCGIYFHIRGFNPKNQAEIQAKGDALYKSALPANNGCITLDYTKRGISTVGLSCSVLIHAISLLVPEAFKHSYSLTLDFTDTLFEGGSDEAVARLLVDLQLESELCLLIKGNDAIAEYIRVGGRVDLDSYPLDKRIDWFSRIPQGTVLKYSKYCKRAKDIAGRKGGGKVEESVFALVERINNNVLEYLEIPKVALCPNGSDGLILIKNEMEEFMEANSKITHKQVEIWDVGIANLFSGKYGHFAAVGYDDEKYIVSYPIGNRVYISEAGFVRDGLENLGICYNQSTFGIVMPYAVK